MAKFRGVILSCKECAKAFKVSPSRAGTAHYCSTRCADGHRRPKKRVMLTCLACGNAFEANACHAHRRKFCSRDCMAVDIGLNAARSARFSGDKNPMWQGGRAAHSEGYVYLSAPNHPFASNGYVFEHRLVIEAWLREFDPESKFLVTLGLTKYLSPAFLVHHRDHDKTHNVVENLQCMTTAEHRRLHNAERA